MILENGVIRTMEPRLPVARALAIAGDVVAGGVGTHETALPSPERVDLGGRCVLPGLNDAHVHFPTWSVARREIRLEGARSLEEAVARVAEAAPSDEESVEAMREGLSVAAARGVTAVHDKDGWRGALGFWQTLAAEGVLTLRVWQSVPAEQAAELAALRMRSGFGDPLLRIGYLKAFMDGTLGSQTARMLDPRPQAGRRPQVARRLEGVERLAVR